MSMTPTSMKKYLPLVLAIPLLAGGARAQTYTWTGAVDSNWQTAGNWSPSLAPSNTTITNGRINVNNGAASTLLYTSAEGSTVISGTTRGLVIASGTNGSMEITGGTFSTNLATTGDIVGNGVNTGVLTVSGGSFIGSNNGGLTLNLGGTGSGTLNVSSGSASVTSLTLGGAVGAGSSTVNLTGGTLLASSIRTFGSTSTFNFDGGTLRARFASTTFMTGLTRANVGNGGARIDTNGVDITISQALLHSNGPGANAMDGGLVKESSGTLILSGVNSFTGDTVVNAGRLTLASTGQLFFDYNGGEFNSISGAGLLTLQGTFLFDLTGAAAGTYTIIDSSILPDTTIASTFAVANSGWTETSGVWTSADGLSSFSELNGQLTISVPEPGAAALLALGSGLVFLVHRSRRAVLGA